jgi:hypothetical protein
MIRTVDFAYAGARIQARYGRLVPAPQWERLQRRASLNSFLQAARDTPLRPWLLQFDPNADAHQIEAQLRALFRRRVGELADWAPARWRPAIDWVVVLPDLPAIAPRQRREPAAPWLADDAHLAQWLPGPAGAARIPPERFAGLQQALAAKQSLAEAWLARWRALCPATASAERRGLEQLVGLLHGAMQAAVHDAPAALAALQRPLRQLFRRNTRAPAGLFTYLALTWIEFSALRGALLRRRLALPLEGAAA